jgi:hypothetical protein
MKKESNSSSLKLISPFDLLKQSWDIFIKRYAVFFGIILIPALYLVAGKILSFAFINILKVNNNEIGFVLVSDFLVVLLFLLFFWSQVSLLYAIVNQKAGVNESYKKGKNLLWAYIVLSLFNSMIVFGGFVVFLIPGIIFSVWLSLAVFVFMEENEKQEKAILKSYEYVRGHWWPILGRILFIVFVLMAIQWIISLILTLFGVQVETSKELSEVISFFFYPLTLIYYFIMYKDIKTIKNKLNLPDDKEKRNIFIIFAVISFIIIMFAVIFLMKYPGAINYLENPKISNIF